MRGPVRPAGQGPAARLTHRRSPGVRQPPFGDDRTRAEGARRPGLGDAAGRHHVHDVGGAGDRGEAADLSFRGPMTDRRGRISQGDTNRTGFDVPLPPFWP
ncbi:hypothetical protein GCM10010377_50780 [Streptomyces viridiviolaceus]|nr:hypothetical protein GCM10010377_50780 [Streptomyces viridiviolaceus]